MSSLTWAVSTTTVTTSTSMLGALKRWVRRGCPRRPRWSGRPGTASSASSGLQPRHARRFRRRPAVPPGPHERGHRRRTRTGSPSLAIALGLTPSRRWRRCLWAPMSRRSPCPGGTVCGTALCCLCVHMAFMLVLGHALALSPAADRGATRRQPRGHHQRPSRRCVAVVACPPAGSTGASGSSSEPCWPERWVNGHRTRLSLTTASSVQRATAGSWCGMAG